MPARYESPDVKSTLTPDEIRQRYRDTALVVFKEQQLYRTHRVQKSERENTYLSFGINRRVMMYGNNGNEPVIVHRATADAVMQANENSRFFTIFNLYQKPRENCTIS